MDHEAFRRDLVARGVVPPTPWRFREPTELTWRHRLLARLMIHGCADAGILAFIRRTERVKVGGQREKVTRDLPPPEPCEPLSVDEAASLAGLRRRFARTLIETKIFKSALRAEKAALCATPLPIEDEDDDE